MIDIHPFASRDECGISAVFGAIKCDECNSDHAYYLSFGFLFWGIEITWFKEDGE